MVIDRVAIARGVAEAERNFGWCYAADELYLIADREIPGADYYDDGALYENGVGAVRRFLEGFENGLTGLPRLEGHRIRLVTGGSMAPFIRDLSPALAQATGADVDVVHAVNHYFGETVTIAGLLGGNDILAALGEGHPKDIVVLPAEALNREDTFIDNVTLSEFERSAAGAQVVRGYEITEALQSARP